MTDLYLARKISGCCPRCGAPSSETSVLCEPHRIEAAARVRVHLASKRATRRKQKQCAICGAKSKAYRCGPCRTEFREWFKLWPGPLAI